MTPAQTDKARAEFEAHIASAFDAEQTGVSPLAYGWMLDAYLAAYSRQQEVIDRLREALNAFMALDRSFATICDEHLNKIAVRDPMGRAVKLARAALKETAE